MQQVQIAHVSEKKKQEVQLIKELVKKYSVLGILNLENLPADQFIKIKHKIQKDVVIKVTKKRLIKLALSELEKEKPNISKLSEMIRGSPALLLTNQDEFKLQKNLNKNKSNAFAKPGQIANRDITINAGPTQFTPGPMIGEFGQLGIKTQVQEGKIHIKEDKLLVKEGEEINSKAASILSKLGFEPIEIGLNLLLTYKNGEILPKEILNINEQEFLNNLGKAYSEAINLAVNTAYPVKETIGLLLKKAQIEALALEKNIPNLDSVSPKEPEKEIEIKTEIKEEKEKTAEKVFQESPKETLKEKIHEQKNNDPKIEVKKVDTGNDEMKRAADILKQLTDKKIRGEI